MGYSVEVVKQLRENNIISEVYLENNKFNKKLSYANKLRIPFVIIIGEEEVNSKILTLKDMNTGEQFSLSIEEIINKVKL
ncbi:MAG: hypothetical protein F8N39_16335 [Clostridiaceae bacterium]|nr:hypothetical protein [Clostridiaceae bacterium]